VPFVCKKIIPKAYLFNLNVLTTHWLAPFKAMAFPADNLAIDASMFFPVGVQKNRIL
jgi:hypothetical protein